MSASEATAVTGRVIVLLSEAVLPFTAGFLPLRMLKKRVRETCQKQLFSKLFFHLPNLDTIEDESPAFLGLLKLTALAFFSSSPALSLITDVAPNEEVVSQS